MFQNIFIFLIFRKVTLEHRIKKEVKTKYIILNKKTKWII